MALLLLPPTFFGRVDENIMCSGARRTAALAMAAMTLISIRLASHVLSNDDPNEGKLASCPCFLFKAISAKASMLDVFMITFLVVLAVIMDYGGTYSNSERISTIQLP